MKGKVALTIAKDLIDDRIPVARHKRMVRWSAMSITRILKNEKYVGDLLQKKTCTPDYLEHKSVKNTGQEEQVYIKDHHPGIISREVWELSQAEWKRRPNQSIDKIRYSNSYWCSGKIYCSECGSSCVARTKSIKHGKYQAWRCRQVTTYGKLSGCSNGQINLKALNGCVQFVLKQIYIPEDSLIEEIQEDIKRVQTDDNADQEYQCFESEIKKVQKKKEKIIDLMLDGVINKVEMCAMKEKYDAELELLQKKIITVQEKERHTKELANNLSSIYNKIKSILSQEKPTTELYRQIVDKIVMYPSNDLDIYIKYIPEPVRLHYTTAGRGSYYKTECSIRN